MAEAAPPAPPVIDLEALRRGGLEAYRRFYLVAIDEEFVQAERLLPPTESLTLSVITRYASYLDSSGAAEAEHIAPLRSWLERHHRELAYLFLLPGTSMPPDIWEAPFGTINLEWLMWLAQHVTDHLPVDWAPAVAFVLLRDWYRELQPLLDALGLGPAGDLVLQARHWLDSRAGVVTSDASEQQKIASGPTLKPPAGQFASELQGRAEQAVARYEQPPPWDSPQGLLLAFDDVHFGSPPLLAEALADHDRVAAALRALAEAPAQATAGYRPSATISRDYWTTEDNLGYGLYADAIAEFVCHDDTRPPLTIGIKAPWGAGKTSLMRMVRARLDPDADAEEDRERRRLLRASERPDKVKATNRLALRRTAPELHRRVGGAKFEPASTARRPTVWFNPWTYQSSEHLWAGLAQAIIDGVTSRMSGVERERFWFDLNIARVDRAVLRRRIHRVLFERVAWFLVPAAVLLAVAAALLATFPELAAAAGGLSLAAVLGAAGRAGRFMQASVGVSFDDLVRQPDYDADAGALHLVQQDMRRVLDFVASDERPLVVFVDDLDRCNAGVVAEVIEALNLFLAGQYPNCVFVLALEPDVVAAHLEVGRADLLKVLADHLPAASHFGMGWRFLDKMVQLPLRLPLPEPVQIEDYIDGVLGGAADRRQLDQRTVQRRAERLASELASVDDLRDTAARVEASERAGTGQQDTAPAPGPRGLDPETIRAAEVALAERLRDDAPEVRAAVRAYAPYLQRNPREVKRFVNLFRFYAFVQVRRQLRDLPAPSLEEVGKMAVLAIRWPYLLSVLSLPVPSDRSSTVLATLEREAGEADTWAKAAEQAGLRDRMRDLIAADYRLRELMATDPPLAGVIGFL